MTAYVVGSELGAYTVSNAIQGLIMDLCSLLMQGLKPVGANHWDPSRSKHRQGANVNTCWEKGPE